MSKMELITQQIIENKIYTIRGLQVMLDRDLADLYQVETRVLNQAVKRNTNRFPPGFMFQLTEAEFDNLTSQFVISNFSHGGRRYLPYVFTEQGVAMLSAVLKSDTAVNVSIQIMQAFVAMRNFFSQNASVFQRLDQLELKQLHTNSHDRFLIIDQKALYHLGASLKDLGNKWFAFSKMDSLCAQVLENLKEGKR